MNSRFDAISRRRAALVQEIARERDDVGSLVAALRTQLAMAGLGLVAARLLRRSRWLRMLATGAALLAAAVPLAARLLPARR